MIDKKFFSSTRKKLEHFEYELAVVKEPIRLESLKIEAQKWALRILPEVQTQLSMQCEEFTRQIREWFGNQSPLTVEGELKTPRIIQSQHSKAQFGQFGGRLMEAFEAAFSSWLAAKVWAVDSGALTICVITATTLAICEGFGWIMSNHLIKRDEVPHESRERIARVTLPAVIGWLVFFFLTYVLRTASGTLGEKLEPYGAIIFAGLGISTLMLITVGFAFHHLNGWSTRATSEYDRMLDLHTRIRALLDPTALVETAPSPVPTPSAGPQTVRPAASTVLAMGLLAFAIAFPLTGVAQTQPNAAIPAPKKGCTFEDLSTSVNQQNRAAALELHKQVLPVTMQHLGLTSWCFVQFTSDAWTAGIFSEATTSVDIQGACAPPVLSETAKLFTPSRVTKYQNAAEKCKAAQQQQLLEIQQSIDSSIEKMLGHNVARQSRCTDVLDSIERVSHTPSLMTATIITDGRENCGHFRKIAPPAHDIKVVVLLVASNNDAEGTAGYLYQQRSANLLKAAPWLTVIRWFEFSNEAFAIPNKDTVSVY